MKFSEYSSDSDSKKPGPVASDSKIPDTAGPGSNWNVRCIFPPAAPLQAEARGIFFKIRSADLRSRRHILLGNHEGEDAVCILRAEQHSLRKDSCQLGGL